jgi:hypothetical protein
MVQGAQFNKGLFSGTDMAIRNALGLEEGRQLRHKTNQALVGKSVKTEALINLVRELYQIVETNLRDRAPSVENWRWRLQTYIGEKNISPEVILERAVAILAEQGQLDAVGRWCNQIPVASGLVDHKSDKRAAVDLARIAGERLDLYELKWKSDTPIYAAFEILLYGLAYLLCRVNQTKFGYERLDSMMVKNITLNVLAPTAYYGNLDLAWLQTGLDAGIRKVSQELLGTDFQASFRFLTLPVGPTPPFVSGAEVISACRATPLAPSAKALVQAISNLALVYPRSNSA